MSRVIHKSAIIGDDVSLGCNVKIGPYVVIQGKVEIGDNCSIESHCHLQGPLEIGEGTKIYSHATLGGDPQDKKYAGEDTRLIIGKHNIIREFVTISRGTIQDRSETKIGDHNLFMSYVHIAHDCVVGHYNTFSNNSTLAGHVHVGDYAGLGGFSAFHQFTKIGSYAFCAGGSIVTKDVPPYTLVAGFPAKLSGLNIEGLKRRGFSEQLKLQLKEAYKQLFRQSTLIHETAKDMLSHSSVEPVQHLARFILDSQRGVTR